MTYCIIIIFLIIHDESVVGLYINRLKYINVTGKACKNQAYLHKLENDAFLVTFYDKQTSSAFQLIYQQNIKISLTFHFKKSS